MLMIKLQQLSFFFHCKVRQCHCGVIGPHSVSSLS